MTETWLITGGRPLDGSVTVQGGKNAVLPLLFSSLLTTDPVTLTGVPKISDVENALDLLSSVGTKHVWSEPDTLELVTTSVAQSDLPGHLSRRFRASTLGLGAMLGRQGEVSASEFGGCGYCERPIDQHLKAFQSLGFSVIQEPQGLIIRRHSWPSEVRLMFDQCSVGATQNALLAAVLGSQVVVMENVSLDPDVITLITHLRGMGAFISRTGTRQLSVVGVPRLHGFSSRVPGDRMVAGTLICAALATRGRVTVDHFVSADLLPFLTAVAQTGAKVDMQASRVEVDARFGNLGPTTVETSPFPGFPTDMQPQFCAAMATILGESTIHDRVYPDRQSHLTGLRQLGASLQTSGGTQYFQGRTLHAAEVNALDLRAGAALLVAALAAEGVTRLGGVHHIQRGYMDLPEQLRQLGAVIQSEPRSVAAVS